MMKWFCAILAANHTVHRLTIWNRLFWSPVGPVVSFVELSDNYKVVPFFGLSFILPWKLSYPKLSCSKSSHKTFSFQILNIKLFLYKNRTTNVLPHKYRVLAINRNFLLIWTAPRLTFDLLFVDITWRLSAISRADTRELTFSATHGNEHDITPRYI